MQHKRLVTALLCFFVTALLSSTSAFAYKECVRSAPTQIWTNAGNGNTWVCFSGSGCVYWTPKQPGGDKLYSAVLASLLSGKKLKVRYANNNHSCRSTRNETYPAVQGIWLLR